MRRAGFCLQLDVGNSSAKWRLMRHGKVESRGRYLPDEESGRVKLLSCAEQLEQVWVASVASAERNADLAELLTQHWGVTAWFPTTAARTGALSNSYAQPERMGVDRWLAMLGAQRRLSGRFAVIDAGSALTVDIVDESGLHEGGYIIPGPALMEKALLLDTDRVRFTDQVDYQLHPGRSTAEAVCHGIALAQAGSVYLALARAGIPPTHRVYCGGGAKALMRLLDATEVYAPDLVFEGLEIMAENQA